MKRPFDVLFITADQWRAECLSALGHPMVQHAASRRPGARAACCSRNHFANAVPCGPSRTSLHTGMYLQNHRSGTNGTPLDARHTNWAKEAAARRLRSGAVRLHRHEPRSARASRTDDPWLRTYEGPLPGIRPLVMMGETPYALDRLAEGRRAIAVPEPIRAPMRMRAPGPGLRGRRAGAQAARLSGGGRRHQSSSSTAASTISATPRVRSSRICRSCGRIRRSSRPSPTMRCTIRMAVPGFSRLRDAGRRGGAASLARASTCRAASSARRADEKKLRRLKAVYYGLMSEVDAALGRVFACLKETGRWDDDADRLHLRSRRADGRSLAARQMRLFRCVLSHPADRARSARERRCERAAASSTRFTENVDIMPTMLEAHRRSTFPCSATARSLQPVPGGQGRAGAIGAAKRIGNTTSAIRPTTRPSSSSTSRCISARMNVIRDERYKYVHFTKLPPLLLRSRARTPANSPIARAIPHYLPLVLEYAQKLLSWRMNHDEQTLTHIALTDDGPVHRAAPRT